jgi:putative transposase
LQGDIKQRCRDLLVQIGDAEDLHILKRVVSRDHVHMLFEYPPLKAVSEIVRQLKGRTSRHLQEEFPPLKS